MYQISLLITTLIILLNLKSINCTLYCYSCVSTEPGCNEYYVDWRIHKGQACPNDDDKCVKIIEKRGDETLITRDCLSNLNGLRTDIPADIFEGCREAAKSKISIYVDNNIKELDLKRDYFDKTHFCFCSLDHHCNSSFTIRSSFIFIFITCLITKFFINFF